MGLHDAHPLDEGMVLLEYDYNDGSADRDDFVRRYGEEGQLTFEIPTPYENWFMNSIAISPSGDVAVLGTIDSPFPVPDLSWVRFYEQGENEIPKWEYACSVDDPCVFMSVNAHDESVILSGYTINGDDTVNPVIRVFDPETGGMVS